MTRAAEAALKMEEYQAKATELSNSASNLGSGTGKDWSQAWLDVDAAQKAVCLMPPPMLSKTLPTKKPLKGWAGI